MSSLILSRRDLDFLLYEWLDIETLTKRPRFDAHSRETFDAVLDLCEKIAVEEFAPHNKKGDQNEPHFDGERVTMIPEVKAALRTFCEAGLMAACMDYEFDGMQLPTVLQQAGFTWFNAANVATTGFIFLTVANAGLLLAHGSQDQIERFAKPQLSGRFFGTMCLSEPQAGSSLSDIRTRAEPQADGTYRVFGNKMWISAGDHELSENIVHLVLAKIPGGPAGVKGISLFIVPKYLVNEAGESGERNDVVLAGLNHKMGFRGITNTLMNFGEGKFTPNGSAGAIGYLVGEANKGLSYMFHMMNEARIAVGLDAAALGYTAYLHSLDYARTRLQGRLPSGKNAAQPQVRLIEHADIKRMLLAQKAYVEGALALNLYCSRLVDEEKAAADDSERQQKTLLLDMLTPIAKSWPSQWCQESISHAIQIHGGYGYTRDYNVEQFYRDNRLNPIHEGTHGIQALDLLGRKVVMAGGAGFELLQATLRATIARAQSSDDAELSQFAQSLTAALERIVAVTRTLHGTGDIGLTLANASAYLEAVGHTVLAWIWLEQMLAAHGKSGDFYDGKRQAGRYFMRWELSKIYPQLDLLETLDKTTLEMTDAWF
ncbi:MAG TPA: acyl-CoA dehydrogenase [Spongiibacteraceae bacterium]|nr:acyl-CoA dehydrogenase [Spongiibacteraceae bacterium]